MTTLRTRLSQALTAAALTAAGLTLATPATATPAPRPPAVTHGPCQFTATPEDPAARPVPLPPDPRHTPDRGRVDVKLSTSQGPITVTLDLAKAPCTALSFLHLTLHRFYDATTCHRLTAYPTLKVLQCGDPSGTGRGGSDRPNLKAEFSAEPHVRGACSMARTNDPNSANSQFFICFDDATFLDRQYTVWGNVVEGMEHVDALPKGEPPRNPGKIVSMRAE